MTDKNLKQEEVALSVKGSRVHSSASIHQLPQANATVLAPAAHTGFTVSPEVVHPSHLSYRMIQSSFQHYPPLPLPVSLSGPKTNQITNDLGPPIFMPPLNLGVPKSSMPSSKQQQQQPQQSGAAGAGLAVVSSVPPSTSTIPSSSSHIDGTSSPTAMLSSYPDLTTPPSAAASFQHASAILHPPQQTFQALNATKTSQPLLKNTQSSSNTVQHRMSPHEQQDLQRRHSPSPHYHPNSKSSSGSYATSSNIIGRGGNTSTVQANAINTVKQPPGVAKMVPGGMVELSTSGYVATTGHQYQPVPSLASNKSSSLVKPMKDDRNKTDSVDSPAVSGSGSGLGGSGLLCMEGLPPPVPRNVPSGTEVKQDRPSSHPSNHISDAHHNTTNTMQQQQGSESQIPWPEAVSKNIIIPAPNLTGKDIANLTSASSSPIATNDRTGNDITWLPLTEHHHQPQSINHHPPSSTSTSSSECSSSSNSSSSLLSYINMVSHDSGHPHTGSNTSTGMGMSLANQNTISSPRPSILRKRGFDGRSSVESLNSPSSPVMHKILRQRSRGSPSDSSENHFLKDDILSPRKRPRKQLLHIDSTNDHHFLPHNLQDNNDPSPLMAIDSHNPIASNSMMANERLLGPLPLKEKVSQKSNEEELVSSHPANKSSDVIYISQLRKSKYPIIQLCRRTHRSARNHFRRPADIKHREEESISPHDMCGQGSTWLRSSGWKLQHLSSQLDKMESYESDVIKVLEQLQGKCEDVLKTMSDKELEEKHRKFLKETIMGNIERIKRSKLHTQESKESMMKILNVNGKVVELMKKFAVRLPTKHLVATTSILDELESNPP